MSYSNGLSNLQQLIGNLATNTSRTAKAAEQATTTGDVAAAASTTVSSANGTDATRLSSASGLVSQSLSSSDVRHEKVAALQQAINNGTYNVSATDVASSIINSLIR